MFDNSAGGKITIRNLPHDVLQALSNLAEKHDRSLEAEARRAIRAWVEPQLNQHARAPRMAVVSQRLNYLLDELNGLSHARVGVSKIAEAIGCTHADHVEQWFAGEEEPSFAELTKIASLVGCSRDWLVHGEGQPFSGTYERIPEDAVEGPKWLLQPLSQGDNLPRVMLIRDTTKEGRFAYIKQYSDWHAVVYRTPYHISEEIGSGGEASLAWLAIVFEGLYKRWTTGDCSNVRVNGYLVDNQIFTSLMEGKRHPLNVLRAVETQTSCWWEDIWDKTQFTKHNYWPGWDRLTARIARVIEGNRRMKEQRDALRNPYGDAIREIPSNPYRNPDSESHPEVASENGK